MKEIGIPFKAPMVLAILAGKKTQTRRLCKPMNRWVVQDCREIRTIGGRPHHFLKGALEPLEELHSPYGMPGDRIWVRESIERRTYSIDDETSIYCADGQLTAADAWPWKLHKLPSIFCPRGLSRIALEVTGVRVERLQAISYGDSVAEGSTSPMAFAELWQDLHGAHSWDLDPWVWVVEFKRA